MAGLELDEWQQFVLINALGEQQDRRWAAFEVAAVVPRQNGKGSILEARELGGLFLFDERLLIHSAHQFDTSLEAFRRLEALIEGRDEFSRRVKRISRSHGEEGIELYGPKSRRVTGGQRIRFRTRTKGGGRGFTGDVVLLDEAMILPEAARSAILPIVSARPNPQVWYMGSAVDQQVHEDGIVFASVRERGIRGDDPSLAFFEWSIDAESPEGLAADVTADPAAWAEANPGLGIRISEEHIEKEWRSMGQGGRSFAVERLGVGDWPATDGSATRVIDLPKWNALVDARSSIIGSVCFAFDVSPDRSTASIAAAGAREDGLGHVEIIDAARGTGWIVDRIVHLVAAHENSGVICDGSGPAASLIPELEQRGITVTCVTAKEHAAACGVFYDAIENSTLRHLGTAQLSSAVAGAVKRSLGEAWAWSRKNSTVDISPLVASTLAYWGAAIADPTEADLLPPIFA